MKKARRTVTLAPLEAAAKKVGMRAKVIYHGRLSRHVQLWRGRTFLGGFYCGLKNEPTELEAYAAMLAALRAIARARKEARG